MNVALGLTEQVCQINYHDVHIVEVDWDPQSRWPVIHQNGAWFLLHSPDLSEMTMRHVLDALQYSNEELVLSYPSLNIENFLDTPLSETPVSQMYIYPLGPAMAQQEAEPEALAQRAGQGQPLQAAQVIADPPEELPAAQDIQHIANLFGLGRVYR